MAKSFLDTNIFFYAMDGRDLVKQQKARALIDQVADSGEGVVSTQVIQEFANNAIKKLGVTPDQAKTLCEAFADHAVIRPDLELINEALQMMGSASLSFWDACIVAAAKQAKCKTLYSEDLNPGQQISGIRVTNPFA